ncbi:hypothetical protein FSARC_12852 [Fusarium sarcochroum]|uniref:AMP-dependent synthetase/ligase domain-containing protein n=1 Tax=Fusarium sarcochroum TaxID=1208366 RepID=A0A8H4T5I0_9HYPO|nr:hypothetical protein FSARC_12852 [Fusarium sarcochroum]
MTIFRTPVSELQANAKRNPSLPALKIPQGGSSETTWQTITFSALERDVELSARYWKDELSNIGVKHRAVVGLWFEGYAYLDIIHTWGLARAGYIPQLISLRMTDPTVLYQLLNQTEAVALVYEPSFEASLAKSPLPIYSKPNVLAETEKFKELPLPPLWESSNAEDVMMIYHTSGSTSGTPKLVPITSKWLDHTIYTAGDGLKSSKRSEGQPTGVAIGSLSHIGSSLLLWDLAYRGCCLMLPATIPYPPSDLRLMIEEYGLTFLNIFPPFLSAVLRTARQDSGLLAALKRLDVIFYGGLNLDPVDETWARSEGLPLANLFGSTELGIIMVADPKENTGYLGFPPANKYDMVPLKDDIESSEYLLELVVPPEAPDCPHPSLRSPDGKFYSGDLFIEVEPGRYISKGRNDSWIKMETGGLCDTGSIESNVMQTCGSDLVSAVVVVGAERPSPAIFVEPKDESVLHSTSDGSHSQGPVAEFQDEIFRRIISFHERRFAHERIDDARYILVVPQGTLPRTATKGNIRRKEVEKVFKAVLDVLYAA